MFFFFEGEKEPIWRQYMEELGLQRDIDYLISKGRPWEWVLLIVEIADPYSVFEKQGKPHYVCQCPFMEGYWLHGGCGSVQCGAAGELLPGDVWYNICSRKHTACPFYKNKEELA